MLNSVEHEKSFIISGPESASATFTSLSHNKTDMVDLATEHPNVKQQQK